MVDGLASTSNSRTSCIALGGTIIVSLFALALPLYVLSFQTPISAATPAELATLHQSKELFVRALLTFTYFPAALLLHFLIVPRSESLRSIFWLGFAFFFAGNAIDLVYRAVQFKVVHYTWAAGYLAATSEMARSAFEDRLSYFLEIAPAISLSFSILFFVGRSIMGVALMLTTNMLTRITGLALLVCGLWNIFPPLAAQLELAPLAGLGRHYLYPWLLSIVFASSLAIKTVATRPGTRSFFPRPAMPENRSA